MMSLRSLIGSQFGSVNSRSWSVVTECQQNSYDPVLSYLKCTYIFKISIIMLAITRICFVSCSRGTMELEYEKYEQVTVERLPTWGVGSALSLAVEQFFHYLSE